MPTARPSINARIGAVLDISMVPESHRMPDSPTATPINAVSIVIPAATSDPKVISRMIIAATTPRASSEPMAGVCFTAPPLSSICRVSVRWASAMAAIVSWVDSGISESWPAKATWAIATRPSGEMALAVTGSMAPTTPGTFPTSSATCAICGA